MTTEFKLPELSEGVDTAEVSQIYISEGDDVQADQNIMELETEKAVTDVPCPYNGKVIQIHVSQGDTIQVGTTLITLEKVESEEAETASSDTRNDTQAETPRQQETDGDPETEAGEQPQEANGVEGPDDREAGETTEGRAKPPASTPESEGDANGMEPPARDATQEGGPEPAGSSDQQDKNRELPPPAGPATRRLARELEVDLDEFRPPGGGRITSEDVVRAFVERKRIGTLKTEPLPDFAEFGPVEREPLNQIAQTAARRLGIAWQTVPHVTQHGIADITELEAARRKHAKQADIGSAKITLTAIVLKSVTGLLREFPKFNSSLDTDNNELVMKRYYHIGVAVDTKHGLLVPVIRDVDRKSTEQLAEEINALAVKARRRELRKDDLQGGTFSISNQGGIGGGAFTPIVNFPEVAILGLGRARPELQLREGQPVERLMLPLSLSYDHRVVNGADAARFISRLSEVLSDAFSLLVAT